MFNTIEEARKEQERLADAGIASVIIENEFGFAVKQTGFMH